MNTRETVEKIVDSLSDRIIEVHGHSGYDYRTLLKEMLDRISIKQMKMQLLNYSNYYRLLLKESRKYVLSVVAGEYSSRIVIEDTVDSSINRPCVTIDVPDNWYGVDLGLMLKNRLRDRSYGMLVMCVNKIEQLSIIPYLLREGMEKGSLRLYVNGNIATMEDIDLYEKRFWIYELQQELESLVGDREDSEEILLADLDNIPQFNIDKNCLEETETKLKDILTTLKFGDKQKIARSGLDNFKVNYTLRGIEIVR